MTAWSHTGTYNFPGNYKIVYRVNNTGDYRTLAGNLSTGRNYTLAASPAALGLASNERVTEIMHRGYKTEPCSHCR